MYQQGSFPCCRALIQMDSYKSSQDQVVERNLYQFCPTEQSVPQRGPKLSQDRTHNNTPNVTAADFYAFFRVQDVAIAQFTCGLDPDQDRPCTGESYPTAIAGKH